MRSVITAEKNKIKQMGVFVSCKFLPRKPLVCLHNCYLHDTQNDKILAFYPVLFGSFHFYVSLFLPTAYVVRGKVIFWHASIHPSVCLHLGGGVPQPGPDRGVPLLGGGYPTLGTPCWTWLGGTPPWVPSIEPGRGLPLPEGTPPWVPPIRPGRGGTPAGGYPTSVNRWSTWYAAVGMPLAFTQEDFLVCHNFVLYPIGKPMLFQEEQVAVKRK